MRLFKNVEYFSLFVNNYTVALFWGCCTLKRLENLLSGKKINSPTSAFFNGWRRAGKGQECHESNRQAIYHYYAMCKVQKKLIFFPHNYTGEKIVRKKNMICHCSPTQT